MRILGCLVMLLGLSSWVQPDLSELTVEEKVGQLLMAHFVGEEVNDEAAALVQQAYIGGIIYYRWTNGLTGPAQVKNLSDSLQELTKQNPHPIPLFISIDQEGGRVTRLTDGFSTFPTNGIVGKSGDPNEARTIAAAIGKELAAVGINMNLAPVVDINSNPQNPIIGDRSFGSSPELVTRFGAAALQGYHDVGIIPVLKHFPGHGDVTVDSHLALPIINKTKQELWEEELIPFARLSPLAEVIMTGHLLIPALDQEHCATVSPAMLQDLLRGEMGFEGVIMTDSLIMQGVLDQCSSLEEAAAAALLAGCDIILISGGKAIVETGRPAFRAEDLLRLHSYLVNEVKRRRIPMERIDASVERVLRLKHQCLVNKIFSSL